MKSLKIIATLFSVICIFGIISAFKVNDPKESEFVEVTIPMWEMGRKHTLEVAAAMPEEKYNYRPSDVSKTFGQQLVHIGYSLTYFSMGMIKGERVPYEEPNASTLSKKEIIAIVEKGFDDMTNAIQGLGAEDLKVELPFGPNKKITRAQAHYICSRSFNKPQGKS